MFAAADLAKFKQIEHMIMLDNNDVQTKVDRNGKYLFTPWELSSKIVAQLTTIDADLSSKVILVADTVELIPVLLTLGAKKENITYVAPYEHKGKVAVALGVKVVQDSILTWETNMKFDVMVANPPYNNNDILLYTGFFKKGLLLADTVVMIMPTDIESQQVRLKSHNKLIKTHLIHMSENVSDMFHVGIDDIRCVTASTSVTNISKKTVDPLTQYIELFPKRKRLFPRRGVGAFSRKSNIDNVNGIPCITSIYRGNTVQWLNIISNVARKKTANMKTTAPWLVIAQEHPSNGLFNASIIENNGVTWGSGVFAFDAASKSDAEKLLEWITSATIQDEVKKLLKLKNTHSISGPMIMKLPYYE